MKRFYIQLVGEDSYFKHPFIEEDEMTLEDFKKKILSTDTLVLENESGSEPIPRGWRAVPKKMLVPTDKVLAFYEDEDYQKRIDDENARQQLREELMQAIREELAKLEGWRKRRFHLWWFRYYKWFGLDPSKGIEEINERVLKEILEKVRSC